MTKKEASNTGTPDVSDHKGRKRSRGAFRPSKRVNENTGEESSVANGRPFGAPRKLFGNGGTDEREEGSREDETWDVVRDVHFRRRKKACMTAGCRKVAVATWVSNLGNKWVTCEGCQLANFGGWPRGSIRNKQASNDGGGEIWDVIRDRRFCRTEKDCMTEGCGRVAVATWASSLGNVWNTCEECQLADFGGWPVPSDDENDEGGPGCDLLKAGKIGSLPFEKGASFFLDLPDDVLYCVLAYVAPPTCRATVLCHGIAPISREVYESVELSRPSLWSAILHDEYVRRSRPCVTDNNNQIENNIKTDPATPPRRQQQLQSRMSKRLLEHPKIQVREAHLRLSDRTQMAQTELFEMAHFGKPRSLSLGGLRSVLRHYGHPLRSSAAQQRKFGGSFLVECCLAITADERVIVRCVRELVERHGVDPDRRSGEYNRRGQNLTAENLTALCVAAARGMPSVVRYLLQAGASIDLEGTGTFQLDSVKSKAVRGKYTALGFAMAMRDAERSGGSAGSDLVLLERCIAILIKAEKKMKSGMHGA